MKHKVSEKKLFPTFNNTITLLNKLASADSSTKKDIWYATVIENCFFTSKAVETATGNTVSVGTVFTARIPYSRFYKPYRDWLADVDNCFTLNTGDYVFLGILSPDEILTPNNIINIYNKHRRNAFMVKSVKDNTGHLELLQHYHIEGV